MCEMLDCLINYELLKNNFEFEDIFKKLQIKY